MTDIPTSEILSRVPMVVARGHQGSGVFIERGGRSWLVTADHCVRGAKVDEIEVFLDSAITPMQITLAPVAVRDAPADAGGAGIDLAAFAVVDGAPDLSLLPIDYGSAGLTYYQEAVWLGYPMGYALAVQGGRHLPACRSGRISGTIRGEPIYLLDGLASDGNSGGPVFFRNQTTRKWSLLAIISYSELEYVPLYQRSGGEWSESGDLESARDTGFVFAYAVDSALSAIDAYLNATDS